MERRPVNNSDRPGLKLWERVKTGKLDVHEAMAILRGLEPVHSRSYQPINVLPSSLRQGQENSVRHIHKNDWILYKKHLKTRFRYFCGVVLTVRDDQSYFMVEFDDYKFDKVYKSEILEVRGPEEGR
jgi:hypothetical protein